MVLGSLLTVVPVSAQEGEPVSTSITATFWKCPAGMTIETLVPDDCAVIGDGFDVSLPYLRGLGYPLTLADASFDGTSFTWSDLGNISPQIDGYLWAFTESTLPAGATSYAVTGDVGSFDSSYSAYVLGTSYDAPNSVINVYNFVPEVEEPVDSTISIHQRLCGANNYHGGDLFTECHDYLLGDVAEYHVYSSDATYSEYASPNSATGDMDFVIPGTRIYITNGASAWPFQNSAEIYCTDTNTGDALTTGNAGQGAGGALWVEYPEGSSIVCDWYIFSNDRDGIYIGPGQPETPTPPVTATVTPTSTGTVTVTTLPSTGSGDPRTSDSIAWLLAPVLLLLGGFTFAYRTRPGS